jgi:predicted MFS family arabinose efflux permease
VFVVEAALYTAVTPLLAQLAKDEDISKLSAGVLSGAYALGLIPGSLIASRLSHLSTPERVPGQSD